MCRWALGLARYARIDNKLYEAVPRAIPVVVCDHGYTFLGRVYIGPCSGPMCRWALGRAR